MQAHNGDYTHKDKWRHAWDFVILDENDKQFTNEGDYCKDYFCFNKPVFAPASGIVSELIDGIQDNKIGDINTEQNWGNSIVIKHAEYLYSQISHLKEGSIKVKKGDFIKKGDIIGTVGNSGHSPYPHIHFQFQATPYIGSETLDYPLYNYVIKSDKKFKLITFGKPKIKQKIAAASSNKILENTLHFVPGKKFQIKINDDTKNIWEVHTNIWNQSYIIDNKTNTKLYFYENESGLYFTNFYGNKNSDLFILFQALFNAKKSFYKNTSVSSIIRPDLFFKKSITIFQDFIAPFYIFLKSEFNLKYIKSDNDFIPEFVILKSQIIKSVLGKTKEIIKYEIIIFRSGKTEIKYTEKNNEPGKLEIIPIKKSYIKNEK